MKNWFAKLVKKAAVSSEGPDSSYRLLSEADIGKVFVAKDLEPHPNFGKYKILISLHTPGLYAFRKFDLVDGVPQEKLVVSHPARQIYKEVSVDPDTLEKAKSKLKKQWLVLGHSYVTRSKLEARNIDARASLFSQSAFAKRLTTP